MIECKRCGSIKFKKKYNNGYMLYECKNCNVLFPVKAAGKKAKKIRIKDEKGRKTRRRMAIHNLIKEKNLQKNRK
jgi:transcription initiation factor TFIIIB Brf1 subunit/transcription initiation factor TFIIB